MLACRMLSGRCYAELKIFANSCLKTGNVQSSPAGDMTCRSGRGSDIGSLWACGFKEKEDSMSNLD